MHSSTNERWAVGLATLWFALIAIAHFWRALNHIPVIFAGQQVPEWPSVIAGIISMIMAIWLGSLLQRHQSII